MPCLALTPSGKQMSQKQFIIYRSVIVSGPMRMSVSFKKNTDRAEIEATITEGELTRKIKVVITDRKSVV